MRQSTARDTIIATASRLFYQNGYNNTGINKIIREAGIAKATLYSHFRSKDDLCLAYLQDKNAHFLHDLADFCGQVPTGEKQLIAIFDFLLAFFETEDFNGCWAMKTVSEITTKDERIRAEVQQQKAEFLAYIEKSLAKNLPVLEMTKRKRLARQIYLLYEGAVSESFLQQDNWPIEEAKSICTHLLVQ
ncbi:MAG: TetR/AcrR family transcriptional regulator [Bacteroidota bacterium]